MSKMKVKPWYFRSNASIWLVCTDLPVPVGPMVSWTRTPDT